MASQEKPGELLLTIHMSESKEYSWKGGLIGRFNAYVYGYDASRGYDDGPQTTLYAYESLYARLQMAASYGDLGLADGQSYGFRYGYQPDYDVVGLREAERFVQGLKKIERYLEKDREAHGRPVSLGQQVIVLMRAMGIKRAAIRLAQGKTGYAYRDWRELRQGEDIRRYIDDTVEDLRERQKEAAQTAA